MMELELMFSEQKWNILKCLSEAKYSPLQLAQKLNTSIANISQQLKLLDAANLVKKEKIKNRDKGKPRTLFSLTEECAYIIPTMHDFAEKKLLKVTDHHKLILKIWFLENQEHHRSIEKLYWKIEPYLSSVQALAFKKSSNEIMIIAEKSDENEKIVAANRGINTIIISANNAQRALSQKKGLFSSLNDISVLYNPNHIFKSNGNIQA
mgnify:CR=1 FL=1